MNRKILAAVAAAAGLAALAGINFNGSPAAAKAPAAGSAPVAPAVNEAGSPQTHRWTLEGEADLRDSGALELKIRSTSRAPRAFDLVRRLLVGRDVMLVSTRAAIVDATGRAIAVGRLDDALLRVKGTLLPAAQWHYDLDGEATPTFRTHRITVLGFDR